MGKVRACERGWEYAQITDSEGSVEICSWVGAGGLFPGGGCIGKLTESSIYDIWHSDRMNEFRESLTDGQYRYCNPDKCPWLANGTIHEHEKEYDGATEYPTALSVSYDRTCNYACKCCADRKLCRDELLIPEDHQNAIDRELNKFINNVHVISANGRGELFASRHILETLHNWHPTRPKEEISVILETNGSLFDEEHWEYIENLGQYNLKVTVTVMSFQEDTYRFLSGTKLPVSRIIKNLYFIDSLREKGIVNNFEIGTVIQERNFREMPEFTRRVLEEYKHVDCIRHRPYFPFGTHLSDVEKWFYDPRNPYHPYYEEYKKVMADPIFTHPKVLMWSGDETSKQGVAPGAREMGNFNIIKYIATDRKMPEKMGKYFAQNVSGKTHLSIYGYGYVGDAFVRMLEETDLVIDYIIDKGKAGQCLDEHQISPIDSLPSDYAMPIVITNPWYMEEITKALSERVRNPQMLDIRDLLQEIGEK